MNKEVIKQMIWDRHWQLSEEKLYRSDDPLQPFFLPLESRDLDDACEDIYNEVFVPMLQRFVSELKFKMQNQHVLGCKFVTENDIDKTLEEFLEGEQK